MDFIRLFVGNRLLFLGMMKYLRCLVVVLNLIVIQANGQSKTDNFEKAFSNSINELKKKGISKIGYSWRSCIGTRKQNRDCSGEVRDRELYLFWKNGNETFVKKFDNCGEFNEVKITDDVFFAFYEKNGRQIRNEEVKPFRESIFGGKISRNHGCSKELAVFEPEGDIVKDFDYFDLSFKTRPKKKSTNRNYKRNNKLKLVAWDEQIEELIKRLDQENSFKRKAE
jgi:hypothetical protein